MYSSEDGHGGRPPCLVRRPWQVVNRMSQTGHSAIQLQRAAEAGSIEKTSGSGAVMSKHCCEEMEREVERVCEQHPVRFDCARTTDVRIA